MSWLVPPVDVIPLSNEKVCRRYSYIRNFNQLFPNSFSNLSELIEEEEAFHNYHEHRSATLGRRPMSLSGEDFILSWVVLGTKIY